MKDISRSLCYPVYVVIVFHLVKQSAKPLGFLFLNYNTTIKEIDLKPFAILFQTGMFPDTVVWDLSAKSYSQVHVILKQARSNFYWIEHLELRLYLAVFTNLKTNSNYDIPPSLFKS